MDKCGTKEFANIDKKVREAQIQLLYQQTWTGLSGIFCMSGFLPPSAKPLQRAAN